VAGWLAPRFGWRACFFVLGAIGLVAVVALTFLKEPVRRDAASGPSQAPLRTVVAAVAGALRDQPALWLTLAGGTLLVYGSASAMHVVTWLVQERGLAFQTAAYLSALAALAGGFGGNVAGGWFADWCAARWPGGRLWSLALLTVVTTPFSAAFYLLTPASPLFYVCCLVSVAAANAWFGPLFAAVQELSPPSMRSTMIAVGLLALNLFGVGFGPWITGVIGDQYGLTTGLLSSLVFVLLAVIPFAIGARRIVARRV
jgi:predicted MFS family arabinose efflux permease